MDLMALQGKSAPLAPLSPPVVAHFWEGNPPTNIVKRMILHLQPLTGP
jgi:hypothetical protein